MRENDFKALVLAKLRSEQRLRGNAVIASEFSGLNGDCRADLAILGAKLTGIEIKTRNDSLRRLGRQLMYYRKYFDHTILAVDERHTRGIEQFETGDLELWVISSGARITVRKPVVNARRDSWKLLPELLTQHERKKFLEESDGSEKRTRASFQRAFSARYAETSVDFLSRTRGRGISGADIPYLSRYHKAREKTQEQIRRSDVFWENWRQKVQSLNLVYLDSV